jgi:hypothetical protein
LAILRLVHQDFRPMLRSKLGVRCRHTRLCVLELPD